MYDLVGQTVKGYEVLAKIGEGGQGAVYRARHKILKREVALKIVRPDLLEETDIIQRFKLEVSILLQLRHPYIVPVYDHWDDDEGIYIAMQYMPGGSLRHAIRKTGRWDLPPTVKLLDRLADALDAAHENEIVHRDLKQDNILLDENGSTYLSDFGIAKRLNADRITLSYVQLGSPAYLSPEQILNNPVSPQTDIYMLGLLLYETLVGEHPYPKANNMQLMLHQVRDPMPPLHEKRPDLPEAEALDAVLQRATIKAAEDRYEDVLTLAAEFRAAAGMAE